MIIKVNLNFTCLILIKTNAPIINVAYYPEGFNWKNKRNNWNEMSAGKAPSRIKSNQKTVCHKEHFHKTNFYCSMCLFGGWQITWEISLGPSLSVSFFFFRERWPKPGTSVKRDALTCFSKPCCDPVSAYCISTGKFQPPLTPRNSSHHPHASFP